MKKRKLPRLSSRTRQVLDAIYRLGEASARDLLEEVEDLPSYSAARSALRQLYQKGLLRRKEKDFRYVYSPSLPRSSVSRSALLDVLETFFDSSPEKTMEALLDISKLGEYDLDLDRIEKLIAQAKKEGR